jgi:hypothetical protein
MTQYVLDTTIRKQTQITNSASMLYIYARMFKLFFLKHFSKQVHSLYIRTQGTHEL